MYHDLNKCMPGILGRIKPILRVKPCHVIISLELWKLNTALSLFALHIFKMGTSTDDVLTGSPYNGITTHPEGSSNMTAFFMLYKSGSALSQHVLHHMYLSAYF